MKPDKEIEITTRPDPTNMNTFYEVEVSYNNIIRQHDVMEQVIERMLGQVVTDLKGKVIEKIFKDETYVEIVKARVMALLNKEVAAIETKEEIKEEIKQELKLEEE